MNSMIQKLNYLLLSIKLDVNMILDRDFRVLEKIEFLTKKYYLLFFHLLVRFNFGKSEIKIFGLKNKYYSSYGLGFLQDIIVMYKRLLKIADVNTNDVKTVIDVGANIGNFTILATRLYKNSTIYSFEPVPDTYECLKYNTKDLKNVKTYNYALGSKNEEKSIHFEANSSGLARITDENSGKKIKITTLDEFVKSNNIDTIDLLKIDTETFEEEVLKGSKHSLKKVRFIVIEATTFKNSKYTISSLFSLLYDKEYNFQVIGFRNSSDNAEGQFIQMDFLLKNILLK